MAIIKKLDSGSKTVTAEKCLRRIQMKIKRPRTSFFKIEAPEKKPIVIATKDGWWGLTAVFSSSIANAGNTYIVPISLWEAIKFTIKKKVNTRKVK